MGDQKMFGSHDARWLGNGKVSVFDNGSENPEGTRSKVFIVNTKTNEIEWKYEAWDQSSFFTHRQGAAQQLPNGNFLITSSNVGHVFEVTKRGEIAWDFVNPIMQWKSYLHDARRRQGECAAWGPPRQPGQHDSPGLPVRRRIIPV